MDGRFLLLRECRWSRTAPRNSQRNTSKGDDVVLFGHLLLLTSSEVSDSFNVLLEVFQHCSRRHVVDDILSGLARVLPWKLPVYDYHPLLHSRRYSHERVHLEAHSGDCCVHAPRLHSLREWGRGQPLQPPLVDFGHASSPLGVASTITPCVLRRSERRSGCAFP